MPTAVRAPRMVPRTRCKESWFVWPITGEITTKNWRNGKKKAQN